MAGRLFATPCRRKDYGGATICDTLSEKRLWQGNYLRHLVGGKTMAGQLFATPCREMQHLVGEKTMAGQLFATPCRRKDYGGATICDTLLPEERL
ncbi:hypothetical protein RB195_000006 [Necator americanus]|uniref:Uncharacterized protein n=1 Tax=Necator americanus TaxID=51031 RepID=A0ABR1D916_NECAM